MNSRMVVEVDLIGELEDVTTRDPFFLPEDWRPIDTERLKRIVEYLDRQVEELRHEKN